MSSAKRRDRCRQEKKNAKKKKQSNHLSLPLCVHIHQPPPRRLDGGLHVPLQPPPLLAGLGGQPRHRRAGVFVQARERQHRAKHGNVEQGAHHKRGSGHQGAKPGGERGGGQRGRGARLCYEKNKEGGRGSAALANGGGWGPASSPVSPSLSPLSLTRQQVQPHASHRKPGQAGVQADTVGGVRGRRQPRRLARGGLSGGGGRH